MITTQQKTQSHSVMNLFLARMTNINLFFNPLKTWNKFNEKFFLSQWWIMVYVRIKDHELLISDGFATTSLVICTQTVFKIRHTLFWIHLEIVWYFKIIPLQEEKFQKVILHFMWYVLMLLTLSVSLTERSQINFEKAKRNQMQNHVCVCRKRR